MYDLTNRVCSNCLFWSYNTKRVNAGLVESLCTIKAIDDYSIDNHKFTRGSDKCGQWKKKRKEIADEQQL